ncbi:hypothetical protein B566_EDAN017730 [Ephemera danica]|nr:hypothetical protein B566_EDAN017730 [Ephemera danica]
MWPWRMWASTAKVCACSSAMDAPTSPTEEWPGTQVVKADVDDLNQPLLKIILEDRSIRHLRPEITATTSTLSTTTKETATSMSTTQVKPQAGVNLHAREMPISCSENFLFNLPQVFVKPIKGSKKGNSS